jgi:hypothetical protein
MNKNHPPSFPRSEEHAHHTSPLCTNNRPPDSWLKWRRLMSHTLWLFPASDIVCHINTHLRQGSLLFKERYKSLKTVYWRQRKSISLSTNLYQKIEYLFYSMQLHLDLQIPNLWISELWSHSINTHQTCAPFFPTSD